MSFSQMMVDANRFCRNLFNKQTMTLQDKERWTKEFILQAQVELGEVLGEINWKHHKLDRKEINRGKLLEELVDVLKFWVNIVALWNFTPIEIIRCWNEKTRKVERLWQDQMDAGFRFTDQPVHHREANERLMKEVLTLREENEEMARNFEQLQKEYDNVR